VPSRPPSRSVAASTPAPLSSQVTRVASELEAKGLKPWSIRGQALTPLSGIFRFTVRKGWRSDNPIRNLEADEKPAIESRQKRILEEKEIRQLIEQTPAKVPPGHSHRRLYRVAPG
jgi:site-specific recombinase XerD